MKLAVVSEPAVAPFRSATGAWLLVQVVVVPTRYCAWVVGDPVPLPEVAALPDV
ncbi:unnamed protein product [Pararhodospirillum photometricum DSM 122]|uniref:Uncharacterized protein n=1 Tax=Pararhodospirillum photometricum DSM 122 TaxID=1150469 RepID=H6SM49_PARPM|nr:unnamed protein product [Pararhodospirillum photometricum DSM 122]